MIAGSVLYILLKRSESHAVPRHCDELSSTALRQLMLLESRADPRLKLSGGLERRSANRPMTSDVSVHLPCPCTQRAGSNNEPLAPSQALQK
jgi:hypothetical protein